MSPVIMRHCMPPTLTKDCDSASINKLSGGGSGYMQYFCIWHVNLWLFLQRQAHYISRVKIWDTNSQRKEKIILVDSCQRAQIPLVFFNNGFRKDLVASQIYRQSYHKIFQIGFLYFCKPINLCSTAMSSQCQ